MGSLDQPTGSQVNRKIAIENVTGQNATQIQNTFNNNFGNKGWRIIQVVQLGANTFILAEKEV